MKILVILTSLLWLSATWAQECNFNVSMNSFMGNVNDFPQVVGHSLALTRGSSSANCENYRIYFGKGYANNYQRKAYSGIYSLNYNLYRTVNLGNILKDYGDASAGEFIAAQAPNTNTPYTSTFYVSIPDLDSIFTTSPSGVYTDVVPIHFYKVRANGTVEYETSRYLTISFNLPRYAELSIVPENAPHDATSTSYIMDFGTMEQNEELRADLRIKGNVGYEVSLSSMNGGKLTGGSGSTTVPYQIRVGSGSYFSPTPAGAQYTVAQRYFGTSTGGERYNMRVKLGSFGQLADGDYQEVITITVRAW